MADSDCHLQISTKNKLILRDMNLLKRMKHLSIAMSVNTLDENFRRDMDKGSTIRERLDTLRSFHDQGIYTILFKSPIFVGITDWQAIIEQSRDFISEYWFEDLNLRGNYKPVIMRYMQEHIIGLEKSALDKFLNGNMSGYRQLWSKQSFTYFDAVVAQRVEEFSEMESFLDNLEGKLHADDYRFLSPRVQFGQDTAVLTFQVFAHTNLQ